jgi:hypothetical protein
MGDIADAVSVLEHRCVIAEYILSETQSYFARLERGGEDTQFVTWFNRRLEDHRERVNQ